MHSLLLVFCVTPPHPLARSQIYLHPDTQNTCLISFPSSLTALSAFQPTSLLVSRFEFERIDLAITSLLANQPVASESERARDQCQSAPVTPPVNPSFLFLSHVSGHFFFFFIFSHFYVGSMCLVRCLHLGRSCASSSDNRLSDKSFLMLSNRLRFGLPLLLFPGTSIPITLFPTYSSSLLETCPYHFNLLSCTFLDISPTFVVPLILSFLILSILVTPLIHFNILISATSNFFSCAFFTAHVSAPYIIAGLTTVLYTSPGLSNLFFGRTESPISSSSFSILIVFYASSPSFNLLRHLHHLTYFIAITPNSQSSCLRHSRRQTCCIQSYAKHSSDCYKLKLFANSNRDTLSQINLMEHIKLSTSRDFRINMAVLQQVMTEGDTSSDEDSDGNDSTTRDQVGSHHGPCTDRQVLVILVQVIVPASLIIWGKPDLRHNTDRHFDMLLKRSRIKFLPSGLLCIYRN